MEIVEITGERIAEIRPLWEALNEVHREGSTHFKDHFSRFTFDKRMAALQDKDAVAVFVAEEGRALWGYCLASVQASKGEIDSIFVQPSYRGQGVGDALMRAAEAWLSSRKVSSLRVSVAEGNETAFGFYHRRGFRQRFTVLEKGAAL